MTTKPYPALCADCKHSEPEEGSAWSLRCQHPKVNGNDPWALASARKARGTDCRGERERRSFFAVCGIKGKAWEPRPLAAMTLRGELTAAQIQALDGNEDQAWDRNAERLTREALGADVDRPINMQATSVDDL